MVDEEQQKAQTVRWLGHRGKERDRKRTTGALCSSCPRIAGFGPKNQCPKRLLAACRLINKRLLDGRIDLSRHRILNFFGDMTDGTKGSADQGKGLGNLPRKAHVE